MIIFVCLAASVWGGGLSDLENMLEYATQAIEKPPSGFSEDPFLGHINPGIMATRRMSPGIYKDHIKRQHQALVQLHEDTRPLMNEYLEGSQNSYFGDLPPPSVDQYQHVKKFNLVLLDKLLRRTNLPAAAVTEIPRDIARGIKQWGEIANYGLFPAETRPAKLEPAEEGSYSDRLPERDLENVPPRIKVDDADATWLNANLDKEIQKGWHVEVPASQVTTNPSEGFVLWRHNKARAIYHDSAKGCKNLFSFTKARICLMGYKTIAEVLKLMVASPLAFPRALLTPAWQSSKTLFRQLESSRSHPYMPPQALAWSTPDVGRPPRLAMIMMDLRAAYRQFVIREPRFSSYKTYDHVGKRWRFSYSPLLMFGDAHSVYFFAAMSLCIVAILASYGIAGTMYIDDLMIYTHEECVGDVLSFVEALLASMGLPIADDKTQVAVLDAGPSTSLGYTYTIREAGRAVVVSLPADKHGEVVNLLVTARQQLLDKNLQFDLVEGLAGNLVWVTNLERYSLVRFLTGFVKQWTVRPFFNRIIKCKQATERFQRVLDLILHIIEKAPPQSVIRDVDFETGATHIFSDASLEGDQVVLGAFVYNERNAASQLSPFPANSWFHYAMSLSLSGIHNTDRQNLPIDIWETIAVHALLDNPTTQSLFQDRYVYLNIDNSTSGYAIVKLTGHGPVRLDATERFVRLVTKLASRPIVAYIPSRLNIGDATTREKTFYDQAVASLASVQLDVRPYDLSQCFFSTKKKKIPRMYPRLLG